jgi:hypothetical protein
LLIPWLSLQGGSLTSLWSYSVQAVSDGGVTDPTPPAPAIPPAPVEPPAPPVPVETPPVPVEPPLPEAPLVPPAAPPLPDVPALPPLPETPPLPGRPPVPDVPALPPLPETPPLPGRPPVPVVPPPPAPPTPVQPTVALRASETMTVEPADGTDAVVEPRKQKPPPTALAETLRMPAALEGRYTPKLTGVCESPVGREKVLVTLVADRSTVRAAAALASADVSATTTSDSLSFEQPLAAPASAANSRSAAQRDRAQMGVRKGCRSRRDARMETQRYQAGSNGLRTGRRSSSPSPLVSRCASSPHALRIQAQNMVDVQVQNLHTSPELLSTLRVIRFGTARSVFERVPVPPRMAGFDPITSGRI